ncbi:hypothetical protein Tco_0658647 [Tanacetum coccineum]
MSTTLLSTTITIFPSTLSPPLSPKIKHLNTSPPPCKLLVTLYPKRNHLNTTLWSAKVIFRVIRKSYPLVELLMVANEWRLIRDPQVGIRKVLKVHGENELKRIRGLVEYNEDELRLCDIFVVCEPSKVVPKELVGVASDGCTNVTVWCGGLSVYVCRKKAKTVYRMRNGHVEVYGYAFCVNKCTSSFHRVNEPDDHEVTEGTEDVREVFQQHGSGAKRKLSRCGRNKIGNEPILALPEGADDFVVYYDARSKDLEVCLEKKGEGDCFGSFEDSGRLDEEYSEDGASSKEGGFETSQVRRSTRESRALVSWERRKPSVQVKEKFVRIKDVGFDMEDVQHLFDSWNEEPCSDVHQVSDEREVEVLRSFNWPPSELITDDGVLPERDYS